MMTNVLGSNVVSRRPLVRETPLDPKFVMGPCLEPQGIAEQPTYESDFIREWTRANRLEVRIAELEAENARLRLGHRYVARPEREATYSE